jgi:2-polyprenyl-3-methyl-5-hydroxy-6-metoxy-1,4-benzoquinol methylase
MLAFMEYTACNLCGSTDHHTRYPCTLDDTSPPPGAEAFRCTSYGYGKHHTIVQCDQCGLVFTNPRPNHIDLIESYEAVEDPLYLQERAGRVLTFARHLVPLEKMTSPASGRKLLDVGCYTGVFLDIAAASGWETWGIDPSRWAVEQARARGLNAVAGTLASANWQAGSFDVVTMWDVIEHVTDPLEELCQAWRVLRPGGLLVVHTMDIDSWFARVMGSRWPWLMEMHIYYFSRRTLGVMLEKAGFHVLQAQPQGRYQTLEYLGTRVTALFGPKVGHPVERLVQSLHLGQWVVPINLGDLITAYALKPAGGVSR